MSVRHTERLALLLLFASYLLTYRTVCLRVSVYRSLSTFFLSPCPLSPTASLSICGQCASLEPWSCRLTSAPLCMNIHLTGTCCAYYLPIISKSIRRKWHLMWESFVYFCPFFLGYLSCWDFLACALQKRNDYLPRFPVKISQCLQNKMNLHLLDIKTRFLRIYLELSLFFLPYCFSCWMFIL